MQKKFLCEAKITDLRYIAKNFVKVILTPSPKVKYHAGQYLEVEISKDKFIPLSIANRPNGDFIELHLQLPYASNMLMFIEQAYARRKTFNIKMPLGEAYLRTTPHRYPIILIAGGGGFSPMKAILEDVFYRNLNKQIYLYWGVRKPEKTQTRLRRNSRPI